MPLRGHKKTSHQVGDSCALMGQGMQPYIIREQIWTGDLDAREDSQNIAFCVDASYSAVECGAFFIRHSVFEMVIELLDESLDVLRLYRSQ